MNMRQIEVLFGSLCLALALIFATQNYYQTLLQSQFSASSSPISFELPEHARTDPSAFVSLYTQHLTEHEKRLSTMPRVIQNSVVTQDTLEHGAGTLQNDMVIDTESEISTEEAAEVGPAGLVEQSLQIQSGDTFVKILHALGIGLSESYQISTKLGTVFKPRELRPGQDLTVRYWEEADPKTGMQVQSLTLQPNALRTIELMRLDDGSLKIEERKIELASRLDRVSGVIEKGLFRDASLAGLPDSVITKMIHNFSYSVDFQRDIKNGDRFDVVVERFYDEASGKEHTAELVYAGLNVKGGEKKIYRFATPGGSVAYFNEAGESIKKALLRTPIDVARARLSSGFGKRKDPIHGYSRMHRGVDFSAPRGTPVVAAGDGIVKKAGRSGGYGNCVKIQHDSTHATLYGHLHRINKAIRVGHRVRQGEVIGQVGSTGRATGPHLHYEVHINGTQVNPQKVTLPSKHLKGKDLQTFLTEKAKIDKKVGRIPSSKRLAKIPQKSRNV